VSTDPIDSVTEKVAAIFAELAGDPAQQTQRSNPATQQTATRCAMIFSKD